MGVAVAGMVPLFVPNELRVLPSLCRKAYPMWRSVWTDAAMECAKAPWLPRLNMPVSGYESRIGTVIEHPVLIASLSNKGAAGRGHFLLKSCQASLDIQAQPENPPGTRLCS